MSIIIDPKEHLKRMNGKPYRPLLSTVGAGLRLIILSSLIVMTFACHYHKADAPDKNIPAKNYPASVSRTPAGASEKTETFATKQKAVDNEPAAKSESSAADSSGTSDLSKDQAAIAGPEPSVMEAVAFYYARRFEGKRTSSGKRYHSKFMTAAHPTLPLGTRVKIINLSNDKSVIVTITDRCRKRDYEIIDLSRGAARKLGFLHRGSTRVRLIPEEI